MSESTHPILRDHHLANAWRLMQSDRSQEVRFTVRRLQQAPWLALGGVAVTLLAVGWLAQHVTFPVIAIGLLGCGLLLLFIIVAWAVAVVAWPTGFDLPIGPDPEVLVWLVKNEVNERDWTASREELHHRLRRYNAASLERAAWITQRLRVAMTAAALLVLAGFAIVGGSA